jgi:hypothetical protein
LTPDDAVRLKDMLRYDVAFMCDEHPGLVAFVKYATRGAGTHEGRPTLARWDSFSVKLVPLVTPAPNFNITSETWFTYRHPRRSGEATDYKALERVSAARFFGEEDSA